MPRDDNELLALLEPLKVSESSRYRAALMEFANKLSVASENLSALASNHELDNVRRSALIEDIHFSNLIEGHQIPYEQIETLLAEPKSSERSSGEAQMLAANYVEAEVWANSLPAETDLLSAQSLCSIHGKLFRCGATYSTFVPGTFREVDVIVGSHLPISPGAIPRFVQRLSEAYRHGPQKERILNLAFAHHRLVWVHPFVDGNGRVARFVSTQMLANTLPATRYWSLSKALYESKERYFELLAACDMPRQGDRDGRGNMSEAALAEFSSFVLNLCFSKVRETTENLESA